MTIWQSEIATALASDINLWKKRIQCFCAQIRVSRAQILKMEISSSVFKRYKLSFTCQYRHQSLKTLWPNYIANVTRRQQFQLPQWQFSYTCRKVWKPLLVIIRINHIFTNFKDWWPSCNYLTLLNRVVQQEDQD